MDDEVTMEMVAFALEHEVEQAAWDVWTAAYPHFTEESFITFEKFKRKLIEERPTETLKTNEEILDEIGKVVKNFEERQGKKHEDI